MLEKEKAERDKDKQTYREVPFAVPEDSLLSSPPPPSFSVSTCLQHSRRSKSYFGNDDFDAILTSRQTCEKL